MKCKLCGREFEESELMDGLCKDCMDDFASAMWNTPELM